MIYSRINFSDSIPTNWKIEIQNQQGVREILPISGNTAYLSSYRSFLNYQDTARFQLRYVNEIGVAGDWQGCTGYTPIALDLNRSGSIERIEKVVAIDITGDGRIDNLREWFAPTEGILIDTSIPIVDGMVTGEHLFGGDGKSYRDGFAKLADRKDSNGDGKVSGEELQDQLALWVDNNSNARMDKGELRSLDSEHIISLSTFHKDFKSYAVLSDGSFMLMEDVWFN